MPPLDKSDAVLGKFTEVPSQTLSTDLMAAQGAVEGPIIFKMNEKSEDGKGQWCLMVDRFARGQGYYPLITTDLSSGEFRMLDQSEYSFPKDSKFRHGYVMPVTASEYSALQRKWGADDYVDKYQLEKAIADAEALNPYDYTEESWKVFEEALNTAKTALDTVKTTEEADAAAQALRDAMAKLEPKVEVALESIKVTEPDKTEYVEGEELDLTGMTVTAVYSDGREVPVDLKDVKVDGYDKDQVGTQTITVTYEGKEAAFTVTVKAKDEGGNQGGDQGGDQGGEDLNGNNPGGDNSGGNNPGGENPDGNNPAGGQDSGSADQGVVQTDAPAKTGDVAPIGIAVLLLVAAGAAIVVIVKKKRS